MNLSKISLRKNIFVEGIKMRINKSLLKRIEERKHSPPVKILSLFSGCGGIDLGFEGGFSFLGEEYPKHNVTIEFANDILKPAQKCYVHNFHKQINEKSITDLTDNDLPDTNIDLVIGSCPCQPFSYAGKRQGLSDSRGLLYQELIRIIKIYQPKMFVSENVDGIRNCKKNVQGETVDKSALDTMISAFEEAGYCCLYQVLNAADYGVPQTRRRVIIIGIRLDLGTVEDIQYPDPTHSEIDPNLNKWVTAQESIDDLFDQLGKTTIPNHTVRDVSKAKFYPGKKMQGNNQIDPNRPAPTIRAEHHGNIEAHYRSQDGTIENPDMNTWRRLSVRECARIQSFPDTYDFPVSTSSAYKVIGNAVPPVLAWHIAEAVLKTLNNLEGTSD